jgi:hypothetical protein
MLNQKQKKRKERKKNKQNRQVRATALSPNVRQSESENMGSCGYLVAAGGYAAVDGAGQLLTSWNPLTFLPLLAPLPLSPSFLPQLSPPCLPLRLPPLLPIFPSLTSEVRNLITVAQQCVFSSDPAGSLSNSSTRQ